MPKEFTDYEKISRGEEKKMGNRIKNTSQDERRRDYLKVCILLKEARANHAIYKNRESLEELKEKEREAKRFYVKIPSDVSCESLFGLMDSGMPLYPQSEASV